LNNTEHCSFCGSSIESGSQFCQNCGAVLSDVEKTQPAQSMPTTPSASTGYYQQPAAQPSPYYQQPATVYVPQKKEDTLGILLLLWEYWVGLVFYQSLGTFLQLSMGI
jgi:hypothetical protein